MRRATLVTLMAVMIPGASWIIGCAPASFTKDAATCANPSNGTCSVDDNGKNSYDQTINTSAIPLDVLVISDNSGSMSVNQRSLGAKFPAFLNTISQYDYHVAVTTTDVSGTGLNGRDGSLVTMSDGSSFISRSSGNAQTMFQTAVQRPETATCDTYLQTHNCNVQSCSDYSNYCPSDDSRAIYAANEVVSANADGFMRSNAPLHVIILSNSDERVLGGSAPNWPLEANDQPATLVQNVKNTFGGGKQLFVHTIVIQPNDTSCLSAQKFSATVFGQYAPVYASASTSTGGVKGTICATDYTAQLNQIAANATAGLQQNFSLSCATNDANLTYTLSPDPGNLVGHVDSTGQTLQFNAPVPANTQLHLTYSCQ